MASKDTFTIYANIPTKLHICFPTEFRNKVWSSQFGKIQNIIDTSEQTAIDFDMSACVWIDPLPLLSLLLTIEKNTELTRDIKLLLPTALENDTEEERKSKIRVCIFLNNEGFLSEFNIRGIKIFLAGEEVSLDQLTQKFKNFSNLLYYQDSCIFPAKIIHINNSKQKIEFDKKQIEEILDNCQHRIKLKVSSQSYEEVYNSLRQILMECIANIFEHAYPESFKVYFGIYIRFRLGLTNPTIPNEYRRTLSTLSSQEHSNSPRLSSSFIESVDNYFELFIIDNGKGFSKSFFREDYFSRRYPFRDAWEMTIRQGERNPNNLKNTRFGGLYILTRIIQKGFITALDAGEWIGEDLPIKTESHTAESIKSNNQIQGLSLICRITWQQNLDPNKNWYKLDEISPPQHPYLNAIREHKDIYSKYLNNKYKELKHNPFYISDQRFAINSINLSENYLESQYSENFIVYLPQEGLNKFEIHRKINKSFVGIANNSKTLIVADIPDMEASIYFYALNDADFYDDFLQYFDRIILVTRNISLLILQKVQNSATKNFTFLVDSDKTASFVHECPESFSPHNSLTHLLEWLKTHDSMLFWRNIFFKLNRDDFFISGEIKWFRNQEEQILENYFNFSQTLSDEVCLILYDIALNRTICLKDQKGYHFQSTDELTARLTHDANLKRYQNHSVKGAKIFIGSVYVTGYTQKAIQRKFNQIDALSIHFFYNQSIKGALKETIPHLFTWPDTNFLNHSITKKKLNHQRVGYSFIVAPYGWKYLTIPRYVQENKTYYESLIWDFPPEELANTKFKSITECKPSTTYRHWQDGKLVSFGHYEYKDQHDIIKVNIPYAFDDSWIMLDDLAIFLVSEFVLALGVEIKDLHAGETMKGKINKYLKAKNAEIKRDSSVAVIVYPYHYSTDHIVKKIKEIFPAQNKDQIVPLIQVNKSSPHSSFLVSPQTIDSLRSIVENKARSLNNNAVSALIFDSSTVSKKTMKDIEHILKLVKVFHYTTITLLDRTMLPIHSFDWQNNKAYWRLDMPKLGHKSSCLLCRGLNKLKHLKKHLVSDILLDRIEEIEKQWSPVYRYEDSSSDHGISAIDFDFLNEEQRELFTKTFSIYVNEAGKSVQIGGIENKIKLTNSYGATIYCSEIHAMTTRDNICLKICNEDIPAEAKLQILSYNLLLFNHEFSFDIKLLVIKSIYFLLKDITNCNNYTALACLSLIAENEIIEADLKNWVFGEISAKINIKNKDLIIFLCEFSQRQYTQIFNKRPEIKRLFKGNTGSKDLIERFHAELFNDYGAPHATPLHYIFSEGKLTKNVFFDAYNSVLKLTELLNSFFPTDFNEKEFKDNIIDHKKKLKSNLAKVKAFYDNYSKFSDDAFLKNENTIKNNVLQPFKNLETILKNIHSKLFIPLNLRNDHEFELKDNILSLLTDSGKNIAISAAFKKLKESNMTIQERWIPWNRNIIKEISYLLDNAKHVKEGDEMFDPFGSEKIKKSMWVTLVSSEKGLIIRFINKLSISTAEDIQKETQKKFKPHQEYIKSIGGSIIYKEYTSLEGMKKIKCLLTDLKLPYIC